MKLKSLFFISTMCACIAGFAQEQNSTDSIPVKATPTYLGGSAIALNVSTVGVGLEYAYNLNTHFNLRARGSFFSFKDYNLETNLDGQSILVIGNADLANADLAVEYLPFTKSSFKLVGGASYFFNGNGSVQLLYNGDIQYGDIALSKEEIGDVTIALDYSGFAPYMGFGFGRAVPKRRVGFGIEIGTYYTGSPDVTVTSTKMLEPTAENELKQIEENFSGYQWLPYITLRLVVKL